MRKAIIALLVTATVALAFIQIDDTHVQTILTGAIKTFQDAIRFQATGGGSEYVGIIGPSVVNTPSVTYKLPQNDGTSGQALVTDGSANLSFATLTTSGPTGPSGPSGPSGPTGTTAATPTPLVFGTPGDLVVFASPELGTYPGSACTPPALALSTNKSGAWTCATPVPAGAAPTDTPLIDLLYSGKLNMGANAASTPLGDVFISANATPAPHDRNIFCTSGASAITYTMPDATTDRGRVIDVCKVDSGVGTCVEDGNSTDTLNGALTRTLSNQWDCDTCQNYSANAWICRGKGT